MSTNVESNRKRRFSMPSWLVWGPTGGGAALIGLAAYYFGTFAILMTALIICTILVTIGIGAVAVTLHSRAIEKGHNMTLSAIMANGNQDEKLVVSIQKVLTEVLKSAKANQQLNVYGGGPDMPDQKYPPVMPQLPTTGVNDETAIDADFVIKGLED